MKLRWSDASQKRTRMLWASSETELEFLPPTGDDECSRPSRGEPSNISHALNQRSRRALEEPNRGQRSLSAYDAVESRRWPRRRGYAQLKPADKLKSSDETHHRGWRKAVMAATALATSVLLVNLSFAIFVLTKNGAEDGVGLIYEGDCHIVGRWNTILHLLINVLSTLLLAAGNYTMQCLSSPTRDEVDAAHPRGVSLDIGIISVRNFSHMRRYKGVLWFCLCITCLPLSFLWNSVIFTTGASTLSSYLVVQDSFLSGATYQQPRYRSMNLSSIDPYCANHTTDLFSVAASMYEKYRSDRYSNMTARECFDAYNTGDGSRYRNLILVTTPDSSMNMSNCGYDSQKWNGSSIVAMHNELKQGANWVLQTMDIQRFSYYRNVNSNNLTSAILKELQTDSTWHFGPYPIKYCLAEEHPPSCKLHFASFILYVVIVCNFAKCFCMAMTAVYLWDLKNPILATVGDAASSFLDKRDESMIGLCLIDHFDLKTSFAAHSEQKYNAYKLNEKSTFWVSRKRKFLVKEVYKREPSLHFHAAETQLRRFTSYLAGALFALAGCAVFLKAGKDVSNIFNAKPGAVSQNALLDLEGDSGTGLFLSIIIANAPQVCFSAAYVFINATATARWGAFEWASYAQQHLKGLRVSQPHGQQRSTYFLQLPWKYGIPLNVVQVVLHFFISQSVFLARLTYYNALGQPISGGFSTVGFSPLAVLIAWLSWIGLGLVVMGSGLLKFNNRIPVHGNKSAVISALCYADSDDSREDSCSLLEDGPNARLLSERLLMWGVTREPRVLESNETVHGENAAPAIVPGHCSFTDRVVGLPEVGKLYA